MKITKYEYHKNFSDNEHGYIELIMTDLRTEDVSEIYKLLDDLIKEINESRAKEK